MGWCSGHLDTVTCPFVQARLEYPHLQQWPGSAEQLALCPGTPCADATHDGPNRYSDIEHPVELPMG